MSDFTFADGMPSRIQEQAASFQPTPVVFAAMLTNHATQMQAVLATPEGVVLRRLTETSLAPLDPSAALTTIAGLLRHMQDAPSLNGAQLVGAAVVMEASFDPAHMQVLAMPMLRTWDGFALRETVVATLGTPNVTIETLTNAALVGEMAEGAGQGRQTAIFIDTNRSISAGLWWYGQVMHRPQLGAVGHIPVVGANMRCACGGRGHLETVASAQALVRWMIGRLVEAPATEAAVIRLTGGRAEALTVAHIWQLACEGDAVATELMSAAITAFASVILTLLLTLDVERVMIGGALAQCGPDWLAAVRQQIAMSAPPTRAEDLAARVVLGHLGAHAVQRGAILLAKSGGIV